MSKPTDVKEFGPDALAQLEQAVLDAINASGSSTTPFQTGAVPIPASTETQLPATPVPSGVAIRVEGEDCYVSSQTGSYSGQIVYEGDNPIELRNVTDLNQLFVTTVKNKASVLRWHTL
jgi:hypothetical protein